MNCTQNHKTPEECVRSDCTPMAFLTSDAPIITGKWVYFPEKENWDLETEIKKSGYSIENNMKTDIFERYLVSPITFWGQNGIHYNLTFTKPFKVWISNQGKIDYCNFVTLKSIDDY